MYRQKRIISRKKRTKEMLFEYNKWNWKEEAERRSVSEHGRKGFWEEISGEMNIHIAQRRNMSSTTATATKTPCIKRKATLYLLAFFLLSLSLSFFQSFVRLDVQNASLFIHPTFYAIEIYSKKSRCVLSLLLCGSIWKN